MANANLAIRVAAENLRSVAFGAISVAYAAIGSGLLNPTRLIYLVNQTDVLLTFSFDAVNDHFVVPGSSYILIDFTSNMTSNGGVFALAQGTIIYVKGTPTIGSVYLTAFYGGNR